ncbi:hypothetical protein [Gracilibacillus massiliensis]|uniref:hypothetical protein n=1 Tax=Gracilibacillus massiliensis TaxID=1564956 RepID=UPI00071D15EA|nr:hypothetical protein [Gracilibacillus massiliensis]
MEAIIIKIFEDWEKKLESDEWYFQNAYERITDKLTSEEAYNTIPDIVNVLLRMENSFLISETIEILLGIYNISNTTEIHPYFKENKLKIEEHLHNFADHEAISLYNELKIFLRI